jgi:hypothetical protein
LVPNSATYKEAQDTMTVGRRKALQLRRAKANNTLPAVTSLPYVCIHSNAAISRDVFSSSYSDSQFLDLFGQALQVASGLEPNQIRPLKLSIEPQGNNIGGIVDFLILNPPGEPRVDLVKALRDIERAVKRVARDKRPVQMEPLFEDEKAPLAKRKTQDGLSLVVEDIEAALEGRYVGRPPSGGQLESVLVEGRDDDDPGAVHYDEAQQKAAVMIQARYRGERVRQGKAPLGTGGDPSRTTEEASSTPPRHRVDIAQDATEVLDDTAAGASEADPTERVAVMTLRIRKRQNPKGRRSRALMKPTTPESRSVRRSATAALTGTEWTTATAMETYRQPRMRHPKRLRNFSVLKGTLLKGIFLVSRIALIAFSFLRVQRMWTRRKLRR